MLNQLTSPIQRLISILIALVAPRKPEPAFVRVRLDVSGLDYIVPNNPAAIESAHSAILDDVSQLVKYNDLPDSVVVLPAPEAGWDDVPSWLAEEYLEEDADE